MQQMLQPMKHLWHSQGSFGNDMTSHASRKNGAPGADHPTFCLTEQNREQFTTVIRGRDDIGIMDIIPYTMISLCMRYKKAGSPEGVTRHVLLNPKIQPQSQMAALQI